MVYWIILHYFLIAIDKSPNIIRDYELKLKSYSAVMIILLGLAGASFVTMQVLHSPFLEHIGIAFLIFTLIVGITWALRKLNKPDAKPED